MGLKMAIDLLWVRPRQVGGIEAYIRNLLDGFVMLENDYDFYLLVSKDNSYSFEHYTNDERFHLHICDMTSQNVGKRIIWQNLYMGNEIKKIGLNLCFEPYYCKPLMGTNGITFFTTIHDLQAIHYPHYFSRFKVWWLKLSWWNSVRTSKIIFAISNFVREDIIERLKANPQKIKTIYNPITVNMEQIDDIKNIEDKYSITEKNFFFTVSSLLPHKNIRVLLDVMRIIKEQNLNLPKKLIVSGIGGKTKKELEKKISEYGLEENIQLTKFIDDAERNSLYKCCYAFLFPSVFEGFGMPPIEAMLFKTPVVTTKMASLEEVTQGKANYVLNPFDPNEWIEKIKTCKVSDIDFFRYDKENIAKRYLAVFKGEV